MAYLSYGEVFTLPVTAAARRGEADDDDTPAAAAAAGGGGAMEAIGGALSSGFGLLSADPAAAAPGATGSGASAGGAAAAGGAGKDGPGVTDKDKAERAARADKAALTVDCLGRGLFSLSFGKVKSVCVCPCVGVDIGRCGAGSR